MRYEAKANHEDRLVSRLKELAVEYPRYGYKLLHPMLKKEGLVINKKRTYRIYTQERLQVRRRRRRKLPRQRRFQLLRATRPNQRWSLDFISDQLAMAEDFGY